MTGKCRINNVITDFLADTGAEKSAISKSTAQHAGVKLLNTPNYTLTDASKTQMPILGEATIQLQYGSDTITTAIPVIDNLSQPCLIGQDILKTNTGTKDVFEKLEAAIRFITEQTLLN